jgi:hypothetical protein
MKDVVVRKYGDRDVIVGCAIKHSSGVSIFYFVHNKKVINNKMSFNFILN